MRWLRALYRLRWVLWCAALSLAAGVAFGVTGSGLLVGLVVVALGFGGSFGGWWVVDRLYRAGILRGH